MKRGLRDASGAISRKLLLLYRRRPVLSTTLIAIFCTAAYWLFIVSDRYVSEMHVVIQRTAASAQNPGNLVQLIAGGGEQNDILLMRDRLLSRDMLHRLDTQLQLRAHFSDPHHDYFSRLSKHHSDDDFYVYFLRRIRVSCDDYSKVLLIEAQAFSPLIAQAITLALAEEGERHMNEMSNQLASEQVVFIERQVTVIRERMQAARDALLAFQNRHSLISPLATLHSATELIAGLETERAAVQTSRATMSSWLTAAAPDIRRLDAQLQSLNRQITSERSRLAARSGQRLNVLAEQQGRLQAEAEFTADLYKTALSALEKSRVESMRKVKSLGVLQSATLPQTATRPRRLYNLALCTIVTLMLSGLFCLLSAIIREHRD